MSIHDSNISRRNLTVWSLAIIAFYIGEGAIDGSAIEIELINFKFAAPEKLSFIVWLILGWFAIRFHLTHRESFTNEWKDSLWDIVESERYGEHIYNVADAGMRIRKGKKVDSIGPRSGPDSNTKGNTTDILKVVGVGFVGDKLCVFCGHKSAARQVYDSRIGGRNDGMVELEGTSKWIIMFDTALAPFTSYIAPHFLWMTALITSF